MTINWGNAPAASYLLTATFYAGDDLAAQAGTFTIGNQDVEVDVNTVGFRPEAILFATHDESFDDTAYSESSLSHGVALDESPVVQACWASFSRDAQAAAQVGAQISSNYAATRVGAGGIIQYGVEIGGFDANGFSAWPRVGNASCDVGYLALDFAGVVDRNAGIINSPDVNGNFSWTDPGFEPQHVRLGVTHMPLVDTAYADGNAGSIGVSVFDENDEYCNSIQDEDASNPTDTQSLSDDAAVNLPNDDGSVGWVANFVCFDTEGWTLDFTQSEGTAVTWWYFAVGVEAPEAEAVVLTSRNLMYIEQVTYREPYGLQLVGGDDERLEVFLAQRGLPNL